MSLSSSTTSSSKIPAMTSSSSPRSSQLPASSSLQGKKRTWTLCSCFVFTTCNSMTGMYKRLIILIYIAWHFAQETTAPVKNASNKINPNPNPYTTLEPKPIYNPHSYLISSQEHYLEPEQNIGLPHYSSLCVVCIITSLILRHYAVIIHESNFQMFSLVSK